MFMKIQVPFHQKLPCAISDSSTPLVSLMTDFSVHKHKFSCAHDTRGNGPGALRPPTPKTFHFQH